eukprot:TRINITY_DN2495_c0_g1_i12.p1 TRINITY_DN2495_c0_g1~~TRINITY_DN2495_c0_g1_i12.p1  ORF type:complete len:129 (-),score=3.32 TRINITY_DN2495_c0_g1_i12:48-434(-)
MAPDARLLKLIPNCYNICFIKATKKDELRSKGEQRIGIAIGRVLFKYTLMGSNTSSPTINMTQPNTTICCLLNVAKSASNCMYMKITQTQRVDIFYCRESHVLCVDTCLLYTSPSPRDGLLSRMPSSA